MQIIWRQFFRVSMYFWEERRFMNWADYFLAVQLINLSKNIIFKQQRVFPANKAQTSIFRAHCGHTQSDVSARTHQWRRAEHLTLHSFSDTSIHNLEKGLIGLNTFFKVRVHHFLIIIKTRWENEFQDLKYCFETNGYIITEFF